MRELCLLILLVMFSGSGVFAQTTADEFFKLGSEQLVQKKYDAAVGSFSECIRLAPVASGCYYNRALAYNNKASSGQSVTDNFTKADGVNVLDPLRLKALADINKSIALNPKFAAAYVIRGTIYYTEHVFDKAALDYQQALTVDTKFAAAYPALFKLATDSLPEARKRYARFPIAKAMGVVFSAASIRRTDKEAARKLYQQAVELYDTAASRDKFTSEILEGRGVAYKGLENYVAALADFNEVLKINDGKANSDYARALLERAEIYHLQSKSNLSLADYEQLIKLPVTRDLEYYIETAYVGRAKTRLDIGQADAAIAEFNKILEKTPAYTTVFYYRGLAHQKKGEKLKAVADFKKVLELNPKHEEAKLRLEELEEAAAKNSTGNGLSKTQTASKAADGRSDQETTSGGIARRKTPEKNAAIQALPIDEQLLLKTAKKQWTLLVGLQPPTYALMSQMKKEGVFRTFWTASPYTNDWQSALFVEMQLNCTGRKLAVLRTLKIEAGSITERYDYRRRDPYFMDESAESLMLKFICSQ